MGHQYFISRKHCPGCGLAEMHPIYECRFTDSPLREYLDAFYSVQGTVEYQYLDKTSYNLVRCGQCGLIFQVEVPSDFLMERIYGHWIDPVKARGRHVLQHTLNTYSRYATEIMRVIGFLPKQEEPYEILDFGMGWGEWALMARAFGCRVYGVELSTACIEHARSHGIPVLSWDDIVRHRFAFINAEQVFEHLREPFEVLVHLKQALTEFGIIRISVPSSHRIYHRIRTMNWSAPRGHRDSLNAIAPLEHVNCYARHSLTNMAGRAGMRRIRLPLGLQYSHIANTGTKDCLLNLARPIRTYVSRTQILLQLADE